MLGLSQVGVAAAAFVAQILLARSISQAAFGTFTAALAAVSLTAPVAVFGVPELWLQRFGQEGAGAYRWVRPSMWLAAGCSMAVIIGLLGWSALEWPDAESAGVRALLASVVAAQAALALAASAQQLGGDYRGMSVLQVGPQAGRVLVAAAVWVGGLSVVVAAAGYAVIALVTVVVCLRVMRPFMRSVMRLQGHPETTAVSAPADASPALFADIQDRPPVRRVVGAGFPFVMGSVFYLVGVYSGTVVAAEFLSAEAAATIAIPMSVLTAIYLIPRIVYQQYFLAKLHRWASSDRGAVLLAYRFGGMGMVLLGVVVAALVAVASQPVLPLLLGRAYRDSALVMVALAAAVPFRFGSSAMAALLTSGGLLRRKVIYQGVGAAVFLAALAVATPLWGIMGTAAANVVAEAVLFCLFWTAVKRRVVGSARLPSLRDLRLRLKVEVSGAL